MNGETALLIFAWLCAQDEEMPRRVGQGLQHSQSPQLSYVNPVNHFLEICWEE